ncbi:RsmB/NOP family class I SAM-dependent RNA methyltransferase [Dyadobacter sp. CY312]|uniref:RsmB/NOP family class I SAM-dependent RNA methyltransferase n=1 Tax=Dyadobacter sp. CY312 TaxID=2907303 RepID=UPI001F27A6B2|nr:RsmB/NOP family class I SAM-dependent RNA methyltransferase [Dyadobacter sp. CY312]MCE7039345.1 RsmB/NOP family class I SAM-dependent RNA methyltransferase [Dyadobacter sp. CY312]
MKIYKGLAEATVTALRDIFVKNRQADRVVEQLLKSNKKWGARDRSFIAENTYEIVRWWRLAKYVAGVDRATDIEEFWMIFGAWQIVKPLHLGGEVSGDLPEWPEFNEIIKQHVLDLYKQALQVRKIAESIPDWLDETGEKELGDKWDTELGALNKQAPLVLRVNTLKSDIATVRQVLGEEETQVLSQVPNALTLKKRKNVSGIDAYKLGFFEVQDAGSQLIAPYLDVKPGMSVVDACAGAGGKTLHLAALLENSGSVLAMDIEGDKLTELQRRATRNGVVNLDTLLITSDEVIDRLSETADRLLLDVPCSGLGVLRRNPDSKWKLKPQFIETIKNVQWHILSTYSQMVKKGGKMVYATCSILPSESEEQVAKFVKKNGKQWKLISEHRTSVANDGFDGFYMALLQKK